MQRVRQGWELNPHGRRKNGALKPRHRYKHQQVQFGVCCTESSKIVQYARLIFILLIIGEKLLVFNRGAQQF